MEPTPPKTQKPRKHLHRPFYETNKKTSAEIISEARSSVRALETKRPFTPAESNRTLFSKKGQTREGRPPSACSIASSYSDSRPPTGKRLSPIQNVPDFKDLEAQLISEGGGYPSSDENEVNNNKINSTKYPSMKDSIIPKPPTSSEPKFSKSNRRPVVQRRVTAPTAIENENRRVQSGPKERSQHSEETMSILKRSNSSGDLSNNLTVDTNNIYFEENLRPLLKQMELNHLHGDIDSLITNFDILWKTLEIGNMLGKSKLGSKRRSAVLTSAYKCTADGNPVLLLKMSRLFLALEVSGKNLEAVCKLMFKVSHNKKYDYLFIEEELIEPMLNLFTKPEQMDLVQCLMYLAGTLKFLSLNTKTLEELIKQNALEVISVLLKFTVDELSKDTAQIKESCHMLVQVTSTLSNFASIDALHKDFVKHNIITLLIELTKTRYEDMDYFMNISRILSKVTMCMDVCTLLHNASNSYAVLLTGLNLHYKKKEIAVRMCYAFGNIANHVADSRKEIAYCVNQNELFLKIANHYFNYLFKEENKLKEEKEISDIEDVLVKVIRVIANLSMDEECGRNFSNSSKYVDIFLSIIDKRNELCDELVINIAATVNNLSFFADEKTMLMKHQQLFADAFLSLLLSENMDCVLEVARVLGNFTKAKPVRDLLLKRKVFEVVIALLESSDPDMIFCTCGVLINMMVDISTRKLLKSYGGIPKLIDVLKDLAESDWLLAGMICQILWNYSEKINTSVNFFGANETDELITILNELLEPELALDYEGQADMSAETIDFLYESWQDNFQPVASMLLNRIEKHHSELEPMIDEPD